MDNYGVKLLTSGYSTEQSRRILLNGMKGYISKRKRRRLNGRKRIHNTAEKSRKGHLKVVPYCESILHENIFQMTP